MTKNTGTRTRTPSAGMEGALLASAADILESEGPDGLSVRRIAAAAGVAPMGVYNHFESKSGIVEALYVQGFERLADAMAAMAQIDDPAEALLEGARAYRALALAHPMAYQVMFLRAVPGFEPSDPALTNCTRGFDLPRRRRRARHPGGCHRPGLPHRDRPDDLGQHPRLGLPRASRPRFRRGPRRLVRPPL